MGNLPDFKAVTKVGDKRWNDIGAGWKKDDKVSIQLNTSPIPAKGKINFLLVPNSNNGKDEE